MKKMNYLIIPILVFAVLVSSCKKDTPAPAEKFSTATVEQNKAVVETAGIDLVNTMSEMKSIESVGVLVNLSDILSSMGGKKAFFTRESKLFSTLETFSGVAKGEKKVNDLFDVMASARELGEDPSSIQEVWDSIVGTYTWNAGLNDWEVVKGGNKVVFLFPSSDISTSNDASITIYNYTGIIITPPLDSSYTGDMPVSLNADLKVGTKTLISFTFAAAYNSDGTPSSIASDLTIEDYKFELDLSNSTAAVSANYKFLAKGVVVMDMGASGEGLFTEANYNENTHTVTRTDSYTYMDYVYNPNTGLYEEKLVTVTNEWQETQTDFEEILHSAQAHFQLFNIAIRGDIDVKGLVDEIRKIDEKRNNETITNEAADSLTAIQINKFLNLRLVNVSNNQIMAKVEAYAKKDIQPEWVDSYIDFRLTFADGSPIDAETYFNNGFGDFITEMNKLITDLNTEYNLGIDTVVYPPVQN